MSKELVIGSSRHETKVAILEDDQLVEIYFQRAQEYSLAGSIHKGRVTRVLPGMQSAFVDLGLERDTFLYVSDFFEEHPDIDTVSDEKSAKGNRPESRRERSPERGASERERSSDRGSAERERVSDWERPSERDRTEETPRHALQEQPIGVAATPASQAHRSESGPESNHDSQRDRRGRRSRRRPSRTHGIPENKYAQPSEAETPAPVETRPTREEPVDHAASDVIILPGESLAKYRHAAPSAGTAERQAAIEPHRVDEIDEPATPIFEAAEEEPQAQSAVQPGSFSEPETQHESVGAQERPAPNGHIRDLRYQDFSIQLVNDLDQQEIEAAEARAEEAAEIAESKSYAALADETPLPALELDREVADVSADKLVRPTDSAEQQSSDATDEAAESGEGSQDEDADGGADEPSAFVEGESGEGPKGESQSATVREQGGRFMHRMSRRMRRRRGGRYNQQNPSIEGGVVPTGPAGAPVQAAEARTEEAKPERDDRPVREDRAAKEDRPQREDRSAKAERAPLPLITELLKPGQEIIVQIAKEPLGQKGARITSHVALPGRYVVFMPSVEHLGVSRKIESDEERHRLKRILQAHRAGTTGGFIVRTAGEGHTEEEIAGDMNFLYNLWLDIRQKAEKKPAPILLHHDLDVVQRILRDQLTGEFKAIWVDNEDMYESVLRFLQRFQPALVNRVKMYTRSAPIFDAFSITQELEKALRPKVWLKSGGYIVINQTEALVAIDVNTGKFVGKSNKLEDTIVKTNTEAVKEIVRQVRLRDLGGIIVVDFIDMDERKNRQKVMQTLEEAMQADKAPYKILQFNDFGLVAITRKRVKQSLERTLCSPCPHCEGAGYVKSVETVIGEILVEAQKIARAIEGKDVVLRCHPEVAKELKSKDNQYLEEIEEVLGRPVLVAGDAQLHQEKFDLA
jgi:ribonuclease G